MLYAQATFRQGLQSFRKRHHPDFRRQLSTPWTSRARCCRSASFHTGELRPADRCLPRLAVHTYGARIHTHSVCKIARSAPEISRIFLRCAVWTQVSTQNERECRTMDDDRVSHRFTDAHNARAASSFHTSARTSESPPSSGELPTLGFSCSMEKMSKTGVRIAKCESDLLLAQIQLSAGGITTFR